MGATRQKKAAKKAPEEDEEKAPLVPETELPPGIAAPVPTYFGEQADILPEYGELTNKYVSEEPIPHHMMRMFLMYLSGTIDNFAKEIKLKGNSINVVEFTEICSRLLNAESGEDKRKAACCGLLDPMQFGENDPGDCSEFLADVFTLLDIDNDKNLSYKELNICTKDFGTKLRNPTKEFPRLGKVLDENQTTMVAERMMVKGRLSLLKKLRQEVLLEREKQLARLASVDFNAGQVSLFVNKLTECGWVERAFDNGEGLVVNAGETEADHRMLKRALESGEVDYCLPNESSLLKGRGENSKFHKLFDMIDGVITAAAESLSREESTDLLDYAEQFRSGVYRYVSSIVGEGELEDFDIRFNFKAFSQGVTDGIGSAADTNASGKRYWELVKGNASTKDAAATIEFMMENYPIKEEEFTTAYEVASGVVITEAKGLGCCNPTYPLWEQLETLYDGQLNYEEFFKYITRGNTSDAGGIAFALHYGTRKTQRLRNCEYFLIYFIFLILYSIFVQTDLDSAKAFYLTKDVDSHVTDDEAQYVDEGSRNYFPWTFNDIANDEEFWSWMTSNVMNYVFSEEGNKPGFQVVQGRTNRIIGGLRLHQYRQEQMNCKDDSDEENLHDNGICPNRVNTGDVRQATSWLDIDSHLTEGGSSAYGSVCLPPLFGYERNVVSDRTFKVCVVNRHNSEVAGEVFRILAEQRLRGVAIEKTVDSSNNCINSLRAGNTHAVIGAWSMDTTADTTFVDTVETLGDHPFPEAEMHTWLPSRYNTEKCETCSSAGWAALTESVPATVDPSTVNTYIDAPSNLGWTTSMDKLLSGYRLGGDPRWVEHVKHQDDLTLDYVQYIQKYNTGTNFFYGDEELGKAYEATKMRMDDSLDPLFKSNINTYISATVKDTYVDVYQLLKSMNWDAASVFSKDIAEGISTAESACNWVKDNEPSWNSWIRTPNKYDVRQRMNQFNVKCFGTWVDDETSESRSSFLDVRGRMTRQALLEANFDDGIYAKKIYDVENGELTEDFVYAPTRAVFFENIRKAELGDIDAETAWKKTQAWVWRSCGEMNSEASMVPYRGKVQPRETVTFYKCNGYGTFLPISKTKVEIRKELDILRLNEWIDLATRGIMLEFFVHSQNSRQIARFQYMVEISAEGAYIPTMNIVTFFLFQTETIKFAGLWYTGLVLLTFAYMYLVLQFIVKFGRDHDLELKAMRREGGSNHGSQWPCNKSCSLAFFSRYIGNIVSKVSMLTMFNYIQLAFLSMFFLGWVVRVVIFVHGMTSSSLFCTDRYPEHLGYVANMYTILQNVEGFSIVLVYINLMSFMEDVEYFSRVSRTILASARMVGILVLSLIISLMAFASGVWILFSSDVEQRLGVWQAMTASVLMTLDTLDTSWMSEAQPNVTLFLFILFYVIVQAVILNVMIGILGDNFETIFSDRFREDEFREITKRDPNCTSWGNPDASWIGVIVFRDFPKAMCCVNTRGRHRYLLWQKNFWKRYTQTLQNFDSFSVQANLCAFQELQALDLEFCSGKQERSVYQAGDVGEEDEEYSFLKRRTMRKFIEKDLEASRVRLLEQILITIPCSYLNIDLSQAWADMLMEHKVWRLHNEKWARFERDEFEHLVATINEQRNNVRQSVDLGASSISLAPI